MRVFILTSLTIVAFAANSILCRIALGQHEIDAASFTSIRLLSGAVTLLILLYFKQPKAIKYDVNIPSSLALFIYAICFSFAYTKLTTGTGAIILFGTVQLTMIIIGLLQGERISALVWLGIALAFTGLVYLMLPGVGAPSLIGAFLMALSGLAWGVYSIRGKSSSTAIASTTWNFVGTVPVTVISSLFFIAQFHVNLHGVLLAVSSGALASGVGYVLWYAVLPLISWTSAAVVQLSVPMIAAFGGVLFMSEQFTLRLAIASTAILGGIALVIFTKKPAKK